MIKRFPAAERGHLNHGWLEARHTFSFGEYHDPDRLGFRALRVINEDVIAPGQGFGLHPHRDMEILTYVISGELTHQDNLGHESVIRPGRVQRMSAGAGIRHAEFNASERDPVHLLQIWLHPVERGLAPEYQEHELEGPGQAAGWQLVAAPTPAGDAALLWHTAATLWHGDFSGGSRLGYRLATGRHAWLQVVAGSLKLGSLELSVGDGVAVSDESELEIHAREASTVLLFDLA